MSRFLDASDKKSKLENVADDLQVMLKNSGDAIINKTMTASVISLESLTDAEFADAQSHFDEVQRELSVSLEEHDLCDESLLPHQKEAGTIALMASGSPSEYHSKAIDVTVSGEGATVVTPHISGSNGSLDFLESNVSLEAFDERELREHAHVSAVYNIAASRQDDFGEAFYPTVVITPDQPGAEYSVSRTVVHKDQSRNAKGAAFDFQKVSLIDAAVDHTILEDNATAIVPYYYPDDSNASYFVDKNLVNPRAVPVGDVEVNTAPLAVGASLDLLSISQAPGVLGGQTLDTTDSLDPRVGLKRLYVKVTKDDGQSVETVVVPFELKDLPRSIFQKSLEGGSHEMTLTFRNDVLRLGPDTRNTAGSRWGATFAGTEAFAYRFDTSLSGTVDLETANIEVFANAFKLAKAYDATTGDEVAITDASVVAALANISFEVIGYDVEATRSNLNHRTRGMIIDTNSVVERYPIPLGSPICVPAPISGGRAGVDTKALIAASRTRSSSNSVTTLLNYAERLRAHAISTKAGEPSPAIDGIGRHLIKPTYLERYIDFSAQINSTSSHEKRSDIQSILVDTIRDVAYRMLRDSNYLAALNHESGGTEKAPKLIIGTDQVLNRYIWESGDERTVSIGFDDFEVVTTPDARMHNLIVLAFQRPNAKGDGLSLGNNFFMPELVANVQVTRNGATVTESQVQTRNLHVNSCPIMGVIVVDQLAEVINEKVKQIVTT
ncbi:hypothetical protein [Endozoicomonas sp. ONNA1]|uniref:hypothetical protein n=1 Tax=Endozoicomonas sp. ONNA1 TaxID=2828740 RepID=UPI002147B8B8|nr:hypothetical protein [Endozoicomonas sp. ONNA1]